MKRLPNKAKHKRHKPGPRVQPKEATPEFTSPAFIQALKTKIEEHYFQASTRKSGGQRFPRETNSDRFFRAIAYCQKLNHDIQRLTARSVENYAHALEVQFTVDLKASLESTRERLLQNYQMLRKPELEALIAGEFLNAAIRGDIERLQGLVDLCRLHKERALDHPENKRYPIPWHYFVGLAACMDLTKGTVPTKKDVKEAAIRHRASVDAVKKYGERTILLDPEIEKLKEQVSKSPPNWSRIFRDLGLSELPSAPTHPRL
jgi:hypothetical protein